MPFERRTYGTPTVATVTRYRDDLGVWHKEGSRAYSHYTMQPGVIGKEVPGDWFDFHQDNGRVVMLNGERICSIEHAQAMGWPDANLVKPKTTAVKCGVKVFTR